MKKTIAMVIAILLAGTATFAQTKQSSKHKHQHKNSTAQYILKRHNTS